MQLESITNCVPVFSPYVFNENETDTNYLALWLSGARPDMIMKFVRLAVFCPMRSRLTPGR